MSGKPCIKENLHITIKESDTPMPYSLLHDPDISPIEGSEARHMTWWEEMMEEFVPFHRPLVIVGPCYRAGSPLRATQPWAAQA